MKRALIAGLLCACGAGETSVSIVFPNAVSQMTARRLRVEAYSPDTGASAATERDCSDFLGLAREGKDPIGTPVRGDYQCLDPCAPTWIDGLELEKVPKGRQIIYVLAYASTEEDATPVLEGCSDQFDTEGGRDERANVEVALQLVLPESSRLVKSAGDRQVGRAGEELSVPLEVRVEADSPTGSGGTYVIPGVPVEFTSEIAGFALLGEASTFSDNAGEASVRVQLPAVAGSGQVVAHAALLDEIAGGDRSEQTFSVSVTDPVMEGGTVTIAGLAGARAIAAAVGNLGGGPGLDFAVLGCRGANANACVTGQGAVAPYGDTALAVVLDIGSNQQVIMPAADLGILPAGMVIADVAPPIGVDEIAFANSRREDCQARSCEGSEILLLRENGGAIELAAGDRYTMTGSNAVALSVFATSRTSYRSLALAAQGRSRNTQACSRANRCLPIDEETPEEGGCPPGERCECPDCNNTNEPGVCVARDKMIDLLVTETQQAATITYNRDGCQMPVVSCDNISTSNCTCLDSERGNSCTGNDGCNCEVPVRIYIGDTDAPVLPYALAAGPLKSAQDWDIVVPSIGGLELVEAKPGSGSFGWKGQPIINAPIHAAAILELDFASEEDNNDPHRADVVWYAKSSCLLGTNFIRSCPVWRDLPAEQTPVGCLGVYYTDGHDSIFDSQDGGPECRRHHLDFLPDGMCTGDFNGDGHEDVALATRQRGIVYVFSGDGRGGLLDPADEIMLPGGAVGGPLACGDIDGNDLDDIIATNAENGTIYVVRTTR